MPRERGFFAERLKQLRAEAGLSQPALAERAEIPVSTIRQFEQGRREPTFATLLKLAAGLDVSLSAFDPPAEGPEPPAPKKPRGKGK
jgi:transcriptional regulator with XRE-family HTH domain